MIRILSGDHYKIQQVKKRLVEAFLRENEALSIELINLAESDIQPSELVARLSSISLFNPRRLIILENLPYKASFTDNIEEICQAPIEGVTLVIVVPDLGKVDSWSKFLRSQKGHRECRALQGSELIKWLSERAQELGTNLSPMAARHLIDRMGQNPLALDNEIQKLRVYPQIDIAIINKLTVASHNSQIFDLLNNIFQGNLKKSLALYDDQRQQKNEPLAILGTFIWQLQIFIIAKISDKSADEISKSFGIHKFPIQKATVAVKKMSWFYLNTLLEFMSCNGA